MSYKPAPETPRKKTCFAPKFMAELLTRFHDGTKIGSMTSKGFTADAVHACYPWISGTTLFNRIRREYLPTESGGKGSPYTFSLEGLVHVGVIDELFSLGAWRSGKFPPEIEIVFQAHEREDERFQLLCQQKQAKLPKNRSLTVHEQALAFYTAHNKHCMINVDIRHITDESSRSKTPKVKRHKQADRKMFIFFYPHESLYQGWGPDNPLLKWDVAAHFAVFTSATIDVRNIYLHVERTLRDM